MLIVRVRFLSYSPTALKYQICLASCSDGEKLQNGAYTITLRNFSRLIHLFLMLIMFAWVCYCSKKLIQQLQCRLKLLKNKRCSIVRLLREDLAELIKIGHEETAFNRVH